MGKYYVNTRITIFPSLCFVCMLFLIYGYIFVFLIGLELGMRARDGGDQGRTREIFLAFFSCHKSEKLVFIYKKLMFIYKFSLSDWHLLSVGTGMKM